MFDHVSYTDFITNTFCLPQEFELVQAFKFEGCLVYNSSFYSWECFYTNNLKQFLDSFFYFRHQVNHFVSTLQQYVQSHLSHVSWCRFLQSLNHKVWWNLHSFVFYMFFCSINYGWLAG